MPTRITCLCLLTAVAACASSGAAPATAGVAAASAASARRDPNVIMQEELADPSLSSLNAYDAIRALRPRFFSIRGPQNFASAGNTPGDPESGQPHASIDGVGVVALDELKNLAVRSVIEIRFLDAAAAMQRFGASAHAGPVIVVRTM
jgi:hypothetical protein